MKRFSIKSVLSVSITSMSGRFVLPLFSRNSSYKQLFLVILFLVSSFIRPLEAQMGRADSLAMVLENFERIRIENPNEAGQVLDQALILAGSDPKALARVYTKMINLNFYELGDIETSLKIYTENKALLDTSENAHIIKYYIKEMLNSNKYAPLILRLRDRKVTEPAFIPSISIRIDIPNQNFFNKLAKDQQKRLRYISSPQFITAKRFHFLNDTTLNEYVIRMDYFPVSQESGDYRLLLNNKYRYSFQFSSYQKDTIQIKWDDEWALQEWVPNNNIRLILPPHYTLDVENQAISLGTNSRNEIIADLSIDQSSSPILVDLQPSRGRSYQYYFWRSLTMATIVGVFGAAIYLGVQ